MKVNPKPKTINQKLTIVIILLLNGNNIFSQNTDHTQYVNPFIGTAKANVVTKWGGEGGTYPGAVVPWGAVQLTPETRISGARGYDHTDSSIYHFSCVQHWSGFPGGSAGRLYVMPVLRRSGNKDTFRLNSSRPFLHQHEQAQPGYYRVVLADDNTIVEATAAEHTGIFRFTFPAHVIPAIFIGDAGEIKFISNRTLTGTAFNSLLQLNKDCIGKQPVKGGYLLRFAPAVSGATVIQLAISVSTVSMQGAAANLKAETAGVSFNQLRLQAHNKWQKVLSVIDVEDNNTNNKTIFYSALYHSLLVPWVISDADGTYRGRDGKLHRTATHAYNAFSPWDTFRTLHPLLCLLYPQRQKEMLESMLNIYRQSGYLPVESMTGNHAIAVMTDSWLKNIKGSDSALAFMAMKKSIAGGPFIQNDMQVYRQMGYVPFSYPESVTRTVEYAYNDWCLAQYAGNVMHDTRIYAEFLQHSFNYRKLFNDQEMFLLPRNGSDMKLHPGTFGYKEGDAWAYSYFVPQNGKDLVNLMGGNETFIAKLDSGFTHNLLVFDNETMFHVPYLFNYAAAPYKAQEWVNRIMRTRFSATPGGLPGNDDLGSMSAWLLFSAMGIYPVCPGRPVYAISTPLFQSVTIHLPNGKKWIIRANAPSAENRYIQSVTVNGKPCNQWWLPHTAITQGGEIQYMLDVVPHREWAAGTSLTDVSETTTEPGMHLVNYRVSKNTATPHEQLWAHFSVQSKGVPGTKVVTLLVNGIPYAHKNVWVSQPAGNEAVVVSDSIPFRLYAIGKVAVAVNGSAATMVEVTRTLQAMPVEPLISNLVVQPVLPKAQLQHISYRAQNIDGDTRTFHIPIVLNGSLVATDTVTLLPGGLQNIHRSLAVNSDGLQRLQVHTASGSFKVYGSDTATTLLDLTCAATNDSLAYDRSGFGNHAHIIRGQPANAMTNDHHLAFHAGCYAEIPNALSVDSMGETITMMLWVYPVGKSDGLVDLFTKGDYHVLQVSGNKQLGFFAGGWGRGDVMADLPANWQNHWHHIAGVCDGNNLFIYIDGILKGTTHVTDRVNLSVPNKFTIGRNEEFPGQRIFEGYIDRVKVYAAPLTGGRIRDIVNKEQDAFFKVLSGVEE